MLARRKGSSSSAMRAVSTGGLQIVDDRWETWERDPAFYCHIRYQEGASEKPRVAGPGFGIQPRMKATTGAIFDERYRVVAVESQSLTIRGVRSGKVLTIVNPNPETPLTPAEYPPGKLIALSDPSSSPLN